MKIILILLATTLSACVGNSEIEAAKRLCEGNNGLTHIWVLGGAVCNNGASFDADFVYKEMRKIEKQ